VDIDELLVYAKKIVEIDKKQKELLK